MERQRSEVRVARRSCGRPGRRTYHSSGLICGGKCSGLGRRGLPIWRGRGKFRFSTTVLSVAKQRRATSSGTTRTTARASVWTTRTPWTLGTHDPTRSIRTEFYPGSHG